MTMNFIDLASMQAGINLDVFTGIHKIVKVTEGTGYVNPYAGEWLPRINDERGIYHFIHANDSARAQADFFLNNAFPYLNAYTRPICDYEPTVECAALATEFMDIIAKETATRCPGPMWYMNLWTARNAPWTPDAKHFPLWIAAYIYGKPTTFNFSPANFATAPGWDVVGQQFTSSGRLPGFAGNLDLSVFDVSPSDWRGNPPPITVKDGYDMATLDDLKHVLTGVLNDPPPAFMDKLKTLVVSAVNAVLLDNSLIDVFDAAGKKIASYNMRHVVTDIFRDTGVLKSNDDKIVSALADLSGLVGKIAAQSPTVDLSAVTDELDKINTRLQNIVMVDITAAIPPAATGTTGATAPAAQ